METNTKKNTMDNKSELLTKKCLCCEQQLPYSNFEKFGKRGYKQVCKHCKDLVKNQNPIKTYTIPQLLRELKERGVQGKFTYTRVETIEL